MGARVWGIYKFNRQEEDLLHSEIDYRHPRGTEQLILSRTFNYPVRSMAEDF